MGFSRRGTPTSIPPIAAFWLLATLSCLLPACTSRPAGRGEAAASAGPGESVDTGTLRLLGAAAFPPAALSVAGEPRVGSLSGVAFDPQSSQWVAVSDDTARPRFVWMDIAMGPTLTIVPRRFTFLQAGAGVRADLLAGLDMEALAPLPDGGFAVTNEGYIDRLGVAHQPAVLFVQRDGTVTAVVHPREHYTITPADSTRGVRHNLGLESLTRTPDGRLMTGLEQPLAQDGPMSNGSRGAVVRLQEFLETRPGAPTPAWEPGREWAYQLEPTPAVAGYHRACDDGENGLSELLALSDVRLLAVERACLQGAPGLPAFNPVRIFEVTLDEADDVSGLVSLEGRRPRPVRKRLVLDTATLAPRLPPLLATMSNFEALAFGPTGPRGERTVLLVSDDNFRATQTTAFLWLALDR